jgi:signal transduction histidine kinase
MPKDEKGFLSHVHGFMPDSTGFLWMSTNQGLFRARWSDVEAWSRDTTHGIFYAYYGKQSGIQNAEFNGGCSPPYVRTKDGWASFPTMDGLVWFRPEHIPDAYPAGNILVERVLVDDVPMGQDLTLAWDHREVVLQFSLAYWGDPENVRLEYQLKGVTGDRWVPLQTGQRELRFGRIPFGDHELKLRKIGALHRGDDALVFRLRVPEPFYRTPWFIAGCVLGLALLIFFIVRLNAARLQRKNLLLEQKVRERTRELVDTNAVLRRSLEMKELLVSIISHDIVTPLRFIARVANGAAKDTGKVDDERLNSTLEDLASSSVKLHANAQDLLNWIKRQDGRIDLRRRDFAVRMLAEEVFDMERERAVDNGVQFMNEIPSGDVIRTDRNVLSIILHNLVANAVTHSAGATVTMSGRRSEGNYLLTVRDTGAGMTPSVLRHAQRVQANGALGAMNEEGERDVQGIGLLIIADLLQLLGGSFSVDSRQGVGTTIELTVPSKFPA